MARHNPRSENGAREAGTIRVDPELKRRLRKAADYHEMSISWFVEEALEVALKYAVPRVQLPPRVRRRKR